MSPEWIKDGRLNVDEAIPEVERFLGLIMDATGLEIHAEFQRRTGGDPLDVEDPDLIVNFDGRDADLLLERRAELLSAIEYLAVRWLKLPPRSYDRVRLDCRDVRSSRIAELELAARTAAESVKQSGISFRFQPMEARERRIVHLALREDAAVRTTSEGYGESRAIVVSPA